jgi:hypothetical protein
MLALSIGLMMQSAYPAPESIHLRWELGTFAVIFVVGICLAIGSTVWQERLAVLSGGIFLAGVLAITDAALLNIAGVQALDITGGGAPRFTGLALVFFAFVASASLLGLGWWRFHGDASNRDGQRFYTILAALMPVWFVGVAVARLASRLKLTDNNTTIAYCAAFFLAAVVLLAVGMLFSRQLQLLGNVLSLSAVILAFASVIASFGLQNFRTTAMIALAATAVAMYVGYRAFSQRSEQVENVGVYAARDLGLADEIGGDVLVLYASGETPPSDAKLMEVALADGLVFRGFVARRSKVVSPSDQA